MRVLLVLLFLVMQVAILLNLDLSLAPGLSVKNAFLYLILLGIIVDTALRRNRDLELRPGRPKLPLEATGPPRRSLPARRPQSDVGGMATLSGRGAVPRDVSGRAETSLLIRLGAKEGGEGVEERSNHAPIIACGRLTWQEPEPATS